MYPPHIHVVRVYYEDTDFSGFVYHAAYLKFMERGRTEFLRSLGIVQSHLRFNTSGTVFVVSGMSLKYLKPAGMDDVLTIATTVKALRGASMVLEQEVSRNETALVQAEVTIASVRDGRAVRLPQALRDAIDTSS